MDINSTNFITNNGANLCKAQDKWWNYIPTKFIPGAIIGYALSGGQVKKKVGKGIFSFIDKIFIYFKISVTNYILLVPNLFIGLRTDYNLKEKCNNEKNFLVYLSDKNNISSDSLTYLTQKNETVIYKVDNIGPFYTVLYPIAGFLSIYLCNRFLDRDGTAVKKCGAIVNGLAGLALDYYENYYYTSANYSLAYYASNNESCSSLSFSAEKKVKAKTIKPVTRSLLDSKSLIVDLKEQSNSYYLQYDDNRICKAKESDLPLTLQNTLVGIGANYVYRYLTMPRDIRFQYLFGNRIYDLTSKMIRIPLVSALFEAGKIASLIGIINYFLDKLGSVKLYNIAQSLELNKNYIDVDLDADSDLNKYNYVKMNPIKNSKPLFSLGNLVNIGFSGVSYYSCNKLVSPKILKAYPFTAETLSQICWTATRALMDIYADYQAYRNIDDNLVYLDSKHHNEDCSPIVLNPELRNPIKEKCPLIPIKEQNNSYYLQYGDYKVCKAQEPYFIPINSIIGMVVGYFSSGLTTKVNVPVIEEYFKNGIGHIATIETNIKTSKLAIPYAIAGMTILSFASKSFLENYNKNYNITQSLDPNKNFVSVNLNATSEMSKYNYIEMCPIEKDSSKSVNLAYFTFSSFMPFICTYLTFKVLKNNPDVAKFTSQICGAIATGLSGAYLDYKEYYNSDRSDNNLVYLDRNYEYCSPIVLNPNSTNPLFDYAKPKISFSVIGYLLGGSFGVLKHYSVDSQQNLPQISLSMAGVGALLGSILDFVANNKINSVQPEANSLISMNYISALISSGIGGSVGTLISHQFNPCDDLVQKSIKNSFFATGFAATIFSLSYLGQITNDYFFPDNME